jgi:hypothetical protein
MKVNVAVMEMISDSEISFLARAIRDVTVSLVLLRSVQFRLLELGNSQTLFTDQ